MSAVQMINDTLIKLGFRVPRLPRATLDHAEHTTREAVRQGRRVLDQFDKGVCPFRAIGRCPWRLNGSGPH